MRTCGGCTACCKTHGIEELSKPNNKWCTHCTIGQGCAIYEAKPKSCSDFRCLWLSGLLPEDERPDKTRVVIDTMLSPVLGHEIIAFLEVSWGGFTSASIQREKMRALRSGAVVSELMSSGKVRMTFPRGYTLSPDKRETLREENVEVGLYLGG